MKIVCATPKLKESITFTERIITRHLTLPILNNIHLKTEKNGLKINSTNLEIGISSWFPCKVEESGEITVPAKIFSSIISGLAADKVFLELKKSNTLEISAENYKAELKGENAKDFPIIPLLNKNLIIKIESIDFCKSLSQVVGFVSNSETRPEITGIFITKDKEDNFLKIVGTDSFRLGENKIKTGEEFKDISFSVIVPARTVAEVIRIFSNFNNVLNIAIEKNQISFESNKTEIISRLIEGAYPDYKKLIPVDFNTKIVVSREEFVRLIKLVSVFSGRLNDISLFFNKNKTPLIKVFATDADLGENSSEMAMAMSGADLEVKFNWKYFLDGLAVISSDKIELNFIDNTKPCLIKSDQDKNFVYLVMPIRS